MLPLSEGKKQFDFEPDDDPKNHRKVDLFLLDLRRSPLFPHLTGR